MARELAVVLVNGSLQSAVACALAAQKHRIVMLLAETGTTAGRPSQAFDALVQHFKPYRSHRVPMPFIAATTRGDDSRSVGQADPRSGEAAIARLIDLTPIVATGLHFAMQYNAVALSLGARVGPEANDLARVTEFGQLWSEMVQMTLDRPQLDVLMPLLEMEPWQVVDLGVQVAAPLQFTWSCDRLAGDPCGGCLGCRMREQAFQRSGRPDPARTPERAAI